MRVVTLWPVLYWTCTASVAWGAASAVPQGPDHQVVEVLPQVTTTRLGWRNSGTAGAAQPTPELAAQRARLAIETARRTGDARYWDRAQTALAPWWNQPLAPVDLVVLEATVLQGQHRFAAARERLRQVVRRAPDHAQAWLTLASLHKLDGHYAEALAACERVVSAGAALYGRICATEVRSLRGDSLGTTWDALQVQARRENPATEPWILSLWGEHLERQGQPVLALQRYRQSMALAYDVYTALAQADLQLRLGRAGDALATLRDAPDTDAVLLRRALAQRRLQQASWESLRDELLRRQQAQERRGEPADAHAREYGLAALWLMDDPAQAWRWAQRNLALQKEPIDWMLALDSARQAGDQRGLADLRTQLAQLGLVDRRLLAEVSDAR